MTKKEVCEILEARGIEHNPLALKAELEALLPEDVVKDAQTEEFEATEDTEHEVTAEDLEVNPADETKIDIYDKNGVYVRTYSKEIHGDNFLELARQFENKIK